MRFVILLFGAAGFSLVVLTGFLAGRPADLVLRDAALGCLASAFVGRWFWRVVRGAFAETLAARRQQEQQQQLAAQEKAAPAAPAPAPSRTAAPARPAPAPAPRGAPLLAPTR